MIKSIGNLFRSLKEETLALINSPQFRAIPPEVQAANRQQINELKAQGAEGRALGVGAQAPDFELESVSGRRVRLSGELTRGPVVLTFYRGKWCPFCNLQLKSLQRVVDAFKEQGASLLAISPQTLEASRELYAEGTPDFELLSDPGNATAAAYGLSYRISNELQNALNIMGLDLAALNGEAAETLPIGATYVVAPDGRIAYAFVDADFTNRPEPADILAALKALNAQKHVI
jgi:peroxiredoxin